MAWAVPASWRCAEPLEIRERQRRQAQLARDPGRSELEPAPDLPRAEIQGQPVDLDRLALDRDGERLHQPHRLPCHRARQLRGTDRLALAHDVERCGCGQVERLAGLVARHRRGEVDGGQPAPDVQAGVGDLRLAGDEVSRAQAAVEASVGQGVADRERQRGAAQAAEFAPQVAAVQPDGGVLAVLRGGQLQVEPGAAADGLPGPGLERREVAHLARELAADGGTGKRHLGGAREPGRRGGQRHVGELEQVPREREGRGQRHFLPVARGGERDRAAGCVQRSLDLAREDHPVEALARHRQRLDRAVQLDRGHVRRPAQIDVEPRGAGDGLPDHRLEPREFGHGQAHSAAERAVGEVEPRISLQTKAGTGQRQALHGSRAPGLDHRLGRQGRRRADQLLRPGRQAGETARPAGEIDRDPQGVRGDGDVGAEFDRAGERQPAVQGQHHALELRYPQVDPGGAGEPIAVDARMSGRLAQRRAQGQLADHRLALRRQGAVERQFEPAVGQWLSTQGDAIGGGAAGGAQAHRALAEGRVDGQADMGGEAVQRQLGRAQVGAGEGKVDLGLARGAFGGQFQRRRACERRAGQVRQGGEGGHAQRRGAGDRVGGEIRAARALQRDAVGPQLQRLQGEPPRTGLPRPQCQLGAAPDQRGDVRGQGAGGRVQRARQPEMLALAIGEVDCERERGQPLGVHGELAVPVGEGAVALQRQHEIAGFGPAGGGGEQASGLAALQVDAERASTRIETGGKVERCGGLVGAVQRQPRLGPPAGRGGARRTFQCEGRRLPEDRGAELQPVDMQARDIHVGQGRGQLRQFRQGERLDGLRFLGAHRQALQCHPVGPERLDRDLAVQQGGRPEAEARVVDLQPDALGIPQAQGRQPDVERQEAAETLDFGGLAGGTQLAGQEGRDPILGPPRLGESEQAAGQHEQEQEQACERDADPTQHRRRPCTAGSPDSITTSG